jgi:membrane-associated protease RseP (regulator of RpoE activity)
MGDSGEYQIVQIEERRLQLGDVKTRKAIWIAVGGVVPGKSGRRVAGMPVLRAIEYRYVATGALIDAEPRVVALREGYASLEVDVPEIESTPPASGPAARPASLPPLESAEARQKLDRTLLGRVRVTATGEESYEINAADLNAALERGLQLAAEAWPKVWPNISPRSGMSLHVESPIADGTLGPRGFRVASPNLAERGGVQVGDVIVGVNGQPVNNFADVYRVYSQMQRDPSLSVIQLELERQGQHLTKIYRIR